MAKAHIRRAAAGGADYVQTPENTAIMELETERLLSELEVEEKAAPLKRLQRSPRSSDLAASGLARHEALVGQGRQPLLSRRSRGEVVARYNKLHMFDVDLAGGESYRESRNFDPGNTAVLADLPWGRLGMSICYDLRFPALYRALATAGADFIAVPAAFTKQTGEAHWRVLLRARAIETGAFVLAACRVGCTRTAAAPTATA